MSVISKVLSNAALQSGLAISDAAAVAAIYRHGALLLTTPSALVKASTLAAPFSALASSVGAPLLGFAYETPENITFASYRYSEYPFLNRASVTNSFIKEPTQITIKAYKPITISNNWIANLLTTQLTVDLIEKYADSGGLFRLNTRWCVISDLALTSFSLESSGDKDNPLFVFNLTKLLFVSNSNEIISKVSGAISQLSKGCL